MRCFVARNNTTGMEKSMFHLLARYKTSFFQSRALFLPRNTTSRVFFSKTISRTSDFAIENLIKITRFCNEYIFFKSSKAPTLETQSLFPERTLKLSVLAYQSPPKTTTTTTTHHQPSPQILHHPRYQQHLYPLTTHQAQQSKCATTLPARACPSPVPVVLEG